MSGSPKQSLEAAHAEALSEDNAREWAKGCREKETQVRALAWRHDPLSPSFMEAIINGGQRLGEVRTIGDMFRMPKEQGTVAAKPMPYEGADWNDSTLKPVLEARAVCERVWHWLGEQEEGPEAGLPVCEELSTTEVEKLAEQARVAARNLGGLQEPEERVEHQPETALEYLHRLNFRLERAARLSALLAEECRHAERELNAALQAPGSRTFPEAEQKTLQAVWLGLSVRRAYSANGAELMRAQAEEVVAPFLRGPRGPVSAPCCRLCARPLVTREEVARGHHANCPEAPTAAQGAGEGGGA